MSTSNVQLFCLSGIVLPLLDIFLGPLGGPRPLGPPGYDSQHITETREVIREPLTLQRVWNGNFSLIYAQWVYPGDQSEYYVLSCCLNSFKLTSQPDTVDQLNILWCLWATFCFVLERIRWMHHAVSILRTNIFLGEIDIWLSALCLK